MFPEYAGQKVLWFHRDLHDLKPVQNTIQVMWRESSPDSGAMRTAEILSRCEVELQGVEERMSSRPPLPHTLDFQEVGVNAPPSRIIYSI